MVVVEAPVMFATRSFRIRLLRLHQRRLTPRASLPKRRPCPYLIIIEPHRHDVRIDPSCAPTTTTPPEIIILAFEIPQIPFHLPQRSAFVAVSHESHHVKSSMPALLPFENYSGDPCCPA